MPTPPLGKEKLQQAIDSVAAHGSVTAAARVLGLPRGTLQHRKREAERVGLAPQVQRLIGGASNAPPDGYKLKGTSTLIREDGSTVLQWVKTDASIERLHELQKLAVIELCKELKPTARIKAPSNTDTDLAVLYTMTDSHVGMLAWDKETGENWDLDIAEDVLTQTLLKMIDAAPASRVGILNQLGDFLHIDSLLPLTPTSKHVLDADSRYQKMVVVAVRILRVVITALLEKHERVHVEMKEGNHDPAGSVWLRVMFSQLYEDNPRVAINMSPNPYTIYKHGKTLLGFYHGHLAKKPQLPILFAAQFAKEWGDTEYRYIHTGHLHHVEEKEHPGVKLIQHPTLAAPDAYAARGGWLSKRQATSMTYHIEDGEVGRGIFVPIRRGKK
jgi:hypothetical protein